MSRIYQSSTFYNSQIPPAPDNIYVDGSSWPAIVDLIFNIVSHRDRLALKRKAIGRRKRRLARRNRKYRGQP
jgi:hypothetical protein